MQVRSRSARYRVRDVEEQCMYGMNDSYGTYGMYGAAHSRHDVAVSLTKLPQATAFYSEVIANGLGVSPAAVTPTDLEVDMRGGGDFLVCTANQSQGAIVLLNQSAISADVKENSEDRARYYRAPDVPDITIETVKDVERGLLGDAYQSVVSVGVQVHVYPALAEARIVSMSGLWTAAHVGAFAEFPHRLTRPTEKDGRVYRSEVAFIPADELARLGIAARRVPFSRKAVTLYQDVLAARQRERERRGY